MELEKDGIIYTGQVRICIYILILLYKSNLYIINVGEKLDHNLFTTGKEQVVEFGNCSE